MRGHTSHSKRKSYFGSSNYDYEPSNPHSSFPDLDDKAPKNRPKKTQYRNQTSVGTKPSTKEVPASSSSSALAGRALANAKNYSMAKTTNQKQQTPITPQAQAEPAQVANDASAASSSSALANAEDNAPQDSLDKQQTTSITPQAQAEQTTIGVDKPEKHQVVDEGCVQQSLASGGTHKGQVNADASTIGDKQPNLASGGTHKGQAVDPFGVFKETTETHKEPK